MIVRRISASGGTSTNFIALDEETPFQQTVLTTGNNLVTNNTVTTLFELASDLNNVVVDYGPKNVDPASQINIPTAFGLPKMRLQLATAKDVDINLYQQFRLWTYSGITAYTQMFAEIDSAPVAYALHTTLANSVTRLTANTMIRNTYPAPNDNKLVLEYLSNLITQATATANAESENLFSAIRSVSGASAAGKTLAI